MSLFLLLHVLLLALLFLSVTVFIFVYTELFSISVLHFLTFYSALLKFGFTLLTNIAF